MELLVEGLLRAVHKLRLKVVGKQKSVIHQREDVILYPNQLEVLALHVGHFHVMGGRGELLKLLA